MKQRSLRALSAFALGIALVAPLLARAEPVPFTQEPFTDIPPNHEHYDAIEYLRKNNIIRGYADGTFKPNRRINRAELVQLATNPFFFQGEKLNDCIKEHNLEEDRTIFYADVAHDAWYAEEVCIATVKDLVDGYPDGTFKPGRAISFVETAKILANVFVLNVAEESTVWYEPYVRELGKRNAIPRSITTLNGVVTRGEVAEILYRLKTKTQNKSSKTYADLQGRFE